MERLEEELNGAFNNAEEFASQLEQAEAENQRLREALNTMAECDENEVPKGWYRLLAKQALKEEVMEVYIVLEHVQYEGDGLKAVYSTAARAQEKVDALTAGNRYPHVWYSFAKHKVQV